MQPQELKNQNLKRHFYDLTPEEIKAYVKSENLPAYRAEQLSSWLARYLPEGSAGLSNIPKSMRESLAEKYDFSMPEIVEKQVSKEDDTVKYALRLRDGNIVEAVLMRYKHGLSICLSSQVGCAMACRFCASGQAGLIRNLSSGEMLAQFLTVQNDAGERIGNIVLMGIGEPLQNSKEVFAFIRKVTSEEGQGISARKISLSSCGIIKEIKKLADLNLPITLSLSLHAPEQKLREKIMPIAESQKLDELMQAVKEYGEANGRRVSFEYALFNNINDSERDAEKTAELLKSLNIPVHLNLIPGNPVTGSEFIAPSRDKIEKFRKIIEKHNIPVSVRRTLGQDIDAACGQLRRRLDKAESERSTRTHEA